MFPSSSAGIGLFANSGRDSAPHRPVHVALSEVAGTWAGADTEMRQHELFQRLVVGHRNAQVSSVPPGSANADKGGALPKVPQHIQVTS